MPGAHDTLSKAQRVVATGATAPTAPWWRRLVNLFRRLLTPELPGG